VHRQLALPGSDGNLHDDECTCSTQIACASVGYCKYGRTSCAPILATTAPPSHPAPPKAANLPRRQAPVPRSPAAELARKAVRHGGAAARPATAPEHELPGKRDSCGLATGQPTCLVYPGNICTATPLTGHNQPPPSCSSSSHCRGNDKCVTRAQPVYRHAQVCNLPSATCTIHNDTSARAPPTPAPSRPTPATCRQPTTASCPPARLTHACPTHTGRPVPSACARIRSGVLQGLGLRQRRFVRASHSRTVIAKRAISKLVMEQLPAWSTLGS